MHKKLNLMQIKIKYVDLKGLCLLEVIGSLLGGMFSLRQEVLVIRSQLDSGVRSRVGRCQNRDCLYFFPGKSPHQFSRGGLYQKHKL